MLKEDVLHLTGSGVYTINILYISNIKPVGLRWLSKVKASSAYIIFKHVNKTDENIKITPSPCKY